MHDLIVIGAGSGGLAAAKRAASAGKKVIIIENDAIGGTCVTYGCVPKKLWHAISSFQHQATLAKHHGWAFSDPIFNWPDVKQRLNNYITSLNQIHENKCLELGIEIIRGTAKLAGPHHVEVNNQVLEAAHVLIAVGSLAVRLPIEGSELCDTSREFFLWDEMPASVVIWGGGYIAVELASILNALGARVDLIIRQPTVLRGFDSDLRVFMHDQYLKRGISIHSNASIQSIKKAGNKLTLRLSNGKKLMADKVIQALGRTPNTSFLNCHETGIQTTINEAIIVNETYQTSIPTISAVGDCIDRVQLTPVAIAQAREWVDKILLNKHFPVDYQWVPTAVFSHPEGASIGLSEEMARQKYQQVSVKKCQFNPLTMALTREDKTPVFMKIIMNGEDQKIVGVHACCEGAAEIIQTMAIAIQKGISKHDLDLTMALHPSIMEELVTLY